MIHKSNYYYLWWESIAGFLAHFIVGQKHSKMFATLSTGLSMFCLNKFYNMDMKNKLNKNYHMCSDEFPQACFARTTRFADTQQPFLFKLVKYRITTFTIGAYRV